VSVLRAIGVVMILLGIGALVSFNLISAFILFILGFAIVSVVPE